FGVANLASSNGSTGFGGGASINSAKKSGTHLHWLHKRICFMNFLLLATLTCRLIRMVNSHRLPFAVPLVKTQFPCAVVLSGYQHPD
ncbi:MAG: hypothetical protein WBV78_08465, partial [Roseobacter sp.]